MNMEKELVLKVVEWIWVMNLIKIKVLLKVIVVLANLHQVLAILHQVVTCQILYVLMRKEKTVIPVRIVEQVLKNNLMMVEEFNSGKEKAFNALIGQVMKVSKGKANPAQVSSILKEKLSK